jgi:phosphoribosylanthranilate isomerase
LPTRLKVCCIASVEEARTAIDLGASALGLVSSMPSGPGVIEEDLITRIAATVPPGVATFLLTSKTAVADIVDQHRRCRTSTIQVVDRLTDGSLADLKEALPGIGVVQVVHVVDEDAVHEAVAAAARADAILLDSGRPGAAVKELGGTGRVHDWDISLKIREAIAPKPLYLAGGLRPANIPEAITSVRPFGLDVCSGVRTNGRLDASLLGELVSAMRSADAAA